MMSLTEKLAEPAAPYKIIDPGRLNRSLAAEGEGGVEMACSVVHRK